MDLSLIHPEAVEGQTAVIGKGCPPVLLPCLPHSASGEAEMVILAPTQQESRQAGWLEANVQLAAQNLAENGLVYTLVPLRARFTVRLLMQRNGLSSLGSFLHLPNLPDSQALSPLSTRPLRHAFGRVAGSRPWLRRLVLLVLHLPVGRDLAANLLPVAGSVYGRANGKPLFHWLSSTLGKNGQACLWRSWRGHEGANLISFFTKGESFPSVWVKVKQEQAGELHAEATALNALGPDAVRSGAHMPRVIDVQAYGSRTALFTSAVPGRPLSALLVSEPARLPFFTEKVAGWLTAWNLDSKKNAPLEPRLLEKQILFPARLLAPLLDEGEAYLHRLEELCTAAAGQEVPSVPAHNDLTTANILWDERAGLGIVDWEQARRQGLPLTDLVYFLADAARFLHHEDRLAAFQSAFLTSGQEAGLVRGLIRSYCQKLGLSPAQAALFFQACWLFHAFNEHSQADQGNKRPFFEILQAVILQRERWETWFQ